MTNFFASNVKKCCIIVSDRMPKKNSYKEFFARRLKKII